jgi:hypothetical protein
MASQKKLATDYILLTERFNSQKPMEAWAELIELEGTVPKNRKTELWLKTLQWRNNKADIRLGLSELIPESKRRLIAATTRILIAPTTKIEGLSLDEIWWALHRTQNLYLILGPLCRMGGKMKLTVVIRIGLEITFIISKIASRQSKISMIKLVNYKTY